jgi:hypothetical protein
LTRTLSRGSKPLDIELNGSDSGRVKGALSLATAKSEAEPKANDQAQQSTNDNQRQTIRHNLFASE